MGIKLHNAGMLDDLGESEPSYDIEQFSATDAQLELVELRMKHDTARKVLQGHINNIKGMMKRMSSRRWKAINDSMRDQLDLAERVMDILGFEDDQ